MWNQSSSTTKIALAAVMAALVCVTTMLIQVPIPATEGFFNMWEGVEPIQGFEYVLLLQAQTFDLKLLSLLVTLIILIHALVSMSITRVLGGGNWIGGFTHLVGIMWIAAVASILTKYVVIRLL